MNPKENKSDCCMATINIYGNPIYFPQRPVAEWEWKELIEECEREFYTYKAVEDEHGIYHSKKVPANPKYHSAWKETISCSNCKSIL